MKILAVLWMILILAVNCTGEETTGTAGMPVRDDLQGSWQMTKVSCNSIDKTAIFNNFYVSLISKFEDVSGSIVLKGSGTAAACEFTQAYTVAYGLGEVTLTPSGNVVCNTGCTNSACNKSANESEGKVTISIGSDGSTAVFNGQSKTSQPGKLCDFLSIGSTIADLNMKKL